MNDVHKAAALAAFLCGVGGCLVYWTAYEKVAAATAEVDRVTDVRGHLRLLERACANAERGQRGFLLTGREEYLRPYQEAPADARRHLDRLYELAPDHQMELARLSREMEDKFAELDQTVRLVRAGDKPKAYTVVDNDRGRVSMERIEGVANDLTTRLTNDLNLRRHEARSASLQAMGAATTFMGLAALLSGFSALGRERRTLTEVLRSPRPPAAPPGPPRPPSAAGPGEAAGGT